MGKARQPKVDKARIIAEARDLFRKNFSEIDEHAGCLFLTVCIIKVAARHGLKLGMQAGSCSWPRIKPEEDDGVVATHFSYVWELNAKTIYELRNGLLPEIHVWAGDPETQEIIDCTTASWPRQCKKLTGAEWTAVTPPDFIWMPAKDVFDTHGAYYEPDLQATHIAAQIFDQYVRSRQ
jgi:hypothetical protein